LLPIFTPRTGASIFLEASPRNVEIVACVFVVTRLLETLA